MQEGPGKELQIVEEIVIRVEVDGVELAPINMGRGCKDSVYEDDIRFFSMGRVFIKDRTYALYDYTFSLSRHKFVEELEGKDSGRVP